jgi:hypothetical protein
MSSQTDSPPPLYLMDPTLYPTMTSLMGTGLVLEDSTASKDTMADRDRLETMCSTAFTEAVQGHSVEVLKAQAPMDLELEDQELV